MRPAQVYARGEPEKGKPLNYPQAAQLVSLHQVAPGAEGLGDFENGLLLSPSMYFAYAENNRSFQSLGVWINGTANVTGLAEPEQVRTVSVSDGVFETLGVPPAGGTLAVPCRPGTQRSAKGDAELRVLAEAIWRRPCGDRAKHRDGFAAQEIVGVTPQGFRVVDADFEFAEPLACYFPARRATLVDPMVALRYD